MTSCLPRLRSISTGKRHQLQGSHTPPPEAPTVSKSLKGKYREQFIYVKTGFFPTLTQWAAEFYGLVRFIDCARIFILL
jgi:hypothetical protein